MATQERQETVYPQKSEATLAALYRNAPVIMFLVDEERRISSLNSFTAAFVDCPATEIIGRRGGELLHCRHCDGGPEGCGATPACRQCRLLKTVRDTFETGRAHNHIEFSLSVEIKGVSKEVFFLLSTKKMIIREQPLVLVCLFDITERKLMEEALAKSEARFRLLAENARDIVFRVELLPEFRCDYISPAVGHILGYTPREILDHPALIHGIISQLLPGDEPFAEWIFSKPIVLKCRHKDQHEVWLELYLTPILNEAGEPAVIEGIARDGTEREIKEQQLQASYAEIEALSKRTLNVMEEERKRLARELHDEVGQALTAVKLDLQMIQGELAGFKNQRERLAKGIALVDKTLQLVRRQSVSLRPPVLDDLGLESAIRDMVHGFMDRTGIQATVRVYGFSKRLPPEMETALYRCVQESLTNIMRHARASRVMVTLVHNAQGLTVRIEDNGIGFEPDSICVSPDHTGLTGMRERVKLLGGELTIESENGRGTRIAINVPRLSGGLP